MAQSGEIPSLCSDISSLSKTVRFSQAGFLFSLGIGMLGQITINMITAYIKTNRRSIESKTIE